MPDPAKLRPGDVIRLLTVPQADLAQRHRENHMGLADAGWTADTIERIIAQFSVVTIDRIDEYGMPWFDVKLIDENGDAEYHSLNITDSESWEYVEP